MSAFRAASFTVALLLALAVAATAAAQDAPARPGAERLPVELSTFLSVGGLDTSSTGVTGIDRYTVSVDWPQHGSTPS